MVAVELRCHAAALIKIIQGFVQSLQVIAFKIEDYFLNMRCKISATLISKRHIFVLQYEPFYREVILLYFVCLKMLLTVVIQDYHVSNIFFHSDSSFLLCTVLYALLSETRR